MPSFSRRQWMPVLVALIALLVIVATSVAPPDEGDPTVSVEGALLVSDYPDVEARALGLSVQVTVRDGGGGPVGVRLTNMDPDRTVLDGLPPGSKVTRGTNDIHVELEAEGDVTITASPAEVSAEFTFFVIGDTQGYTVPLERMVQDANRDRPLFVLHCGDMTPSGTEDQLRSFMASAQDLEVPMFTTLGNHDAKGDVARYLDALAPGRYAFSYGPWSFVTVDTSEAGLEGEAFDWLQETLDGVMARGGTPVVFTHVPPLDTVVEDHAFLSTEEGLRFVQLMADGGVAAVFNGHDHLFNRTTREGVDYYTTGGGGAVLYATPERGGFHHYLRVNVSGDCLEVAPVPLPLPERTGGAVELRGASGNVTLSLEDLEALPLVTGSSSFENQYGNWGGHGKYTGVPLSTLLELVGGLAEGGSVMVEAGDGYQVFLGYRNVHPDVAWREVQGTFILAIEHDGVGVPDWEDGPRLVCLPPDGAYNNQDANATTEQGMPAPCSAGSRWTRDVRTIEVMGPA